MKSARRPATLFGVLLGVLAWAGCGGPKRGAEEPADETVAQAAAVHTAPEQPEATSSDDGARDAPSVIYYDLTHFDWYRHGEPILIEGRRYRPGRVQASGERRFQREGAYDGVDFYVPRGEPTPHDTVYVPVYNGYWLPFALDAALAESAN